MTASTLHKSAASAASESSQPVVATLTNTSKILGGVSRTYLYDLMGSGALESIKIGKRRLVLVASIHRFIEAQKNASPPLAKAA